MMNTNKIYPKWLQEIKRFQALKSEFFLYGNVYDCYYFPVNYQEANEVVELKYRVFENTKDLLEYYLFSQGYEVVTYFDVIDGIMIVSNDK